MTDDRIRMGVIVEGGAAPEWYWRQQIEAIEQERDSLKAKLEYAEARIASLIKLGDGADESIRQLHARVAEVEVERDAARNCLEDFLELTEVPDPNCSCHVNPPCGDCVEYGGIRDVRKTANELLKEGE